MRTVQIDIGELADQLIAARPTLGRPHQRLALGLYELLAEARPVSRERLAQRADMTLEEVGRFLDEQSAVHLDEGGEVVGFWGMTLEPMPHGIRVRGRQLYAWCAWDTLFLPELIGRTVAVRSTCPGTGRPVELVLAPDGVRDVSPAGAVLSFLRRETPFDADTITTFCRFVHFFADPRAADEWTTRHPGTFVLSIDDAAQLARAVNRRSFGDALARRAGAAEGKS
jgi:alkylmercury lyase